ncbi:HIT domain-containing protein, putative [Eimeria tenella]|uniref:HIT domain-containing protein, putative n=1 Tax=Eimeria tenella TaxID=5802 RepID=U6KQB9_EIMTE|nr:HIT domain-containing protein, putative [Eimeria tenella]CDJ40161.1 HIT domain-containing protein, putative [Eimeria tenella]|eukprot:XP_013230914.1 HIT domain-containing protein, putative [Eimeria tenella]
MSSTQQKPYDPDNVFAKILDGRLPCHKIFETESCIAILDAFPTAQGHALLISKAPALTIMDLSEQQAGDVLKELPRLCRAVQKATNCDAVNVLHNGGAAAGQIVHHLHFHVVPRFENDNLFRQFKSASSMITAEEAAGILEKIKANL